MTNADNRQIDDVALSRRDRARSFESMLTVEKQAGAAGPSRPNEWRDDLLMALEELASSLHDQYARSASEDGLLSRVVDEAPQLEPGVRGLRQQQEALIEEVDNLRQSLADLSRTVDVSAIRSRVRDMTAEIRELRGWETDIVYEAYAFDLGTGD